MFTLCSALSLLSCVALCTLWVRSHFVADRLTFIGAVGERRSDLTDFVSYGGTLLVYRDQIVFPAAERDAFVARATHGRTAGMWGWHVSRNSYAAGYQQGRPNFPRDWFGAATERHAGGWRIGGLSSVRRTVRVPHAVVVLALLVCPALSARRLLRDRHRKSAGRCPACGYDLRTTPDRCLECGNVSSPHGGSDSRADPAGPTGLTTTAPTPTHQ